MKKRPTFVLPILILIAAYQPVFSQNSHYKTIDELSADIESRVIEWRHHFHRYPELSNREFKTAAKVADHLKALGLEVKTGIAHTGVVGILRTDRPGPVIGLRADMDALPVTERVDIEFASKEKAQFNGQEVGVMHACGHDTHVAILMGVAEILSKMRSDLEGTLVFIFQPAEEGAPEGEEGGADLMIKEGVLDDPPVEVIFGLHINSRTEVGKLKYRSRGIMAAVNPFKIKVKGKQTHGSTPWTGIDPVVVSAQIINGLQTIVSRQMELTKAPAVISVGSIHGGVRSNIIPEEVEMIGTIRTLDYDMRKIIHQKIAHTATKIAESSGAEAEVTIRKGYPITYNDPDLTALMEPTLKRVAGEDNIIYMDPITGAEDFSFFQEKIPGLFFFIGGMPPGMDPAKAAPHHTPDFYVDDAGMLLGIRAFCNLIFDYASQWSKK